MDREQKIQFIREKCVEANDDFEMEACAICKVEGQIVSYCGECETDTTRPIRLADVLLAIREHESRKENGSNFLLSEGQVVLKYNLRKDSLTEQSPETIDFICTLLGDSNG